MSHVVLTHAYFMADDPAEQRVMKPYPPLGILYLAAWLDRCGHTTAVVDTTFMEFDTAVAKIVGERPAVVGVYANLMTRPQVVKLLGALRATPTLSHSVFVVGGPEVRYHSESFLKHGADYAVIGEGEATMEELCAAVAGGTLLEKRSDIAGLAYLEAEKLVVNAEREKLRQLDDLPTPAREKIDLGLYLNLWKKHHGASTISVSTMRGCPYTCRWCSRAVYGLSYRRRSAHLVADELVMLHERYAPDSFWFVDDVFTVNHRWLQQFADALSERNFKPAYECITRADRLNEEALVLLQKTGCRTVWIGAESGSQRVIDAMDRRVDVVQVQWAINRAKELGMEAGTFIMLGYPTERDRDVVKTLQHLRAALPTKFTITVAYPISGTEFYEAVEHRIEAKAPWQNTNDRLNGFVKYYPERYYFWAVRYVVSGVNASQCWVKCEYARAAWQWAKSTTARSAMLAVLAWWAILPRTNADKLETGKLEVAG